jgi:hypothetical protein
VPYGREPKTRCRWHLSAIFRGYRAGSAHNIVRDLPHPFKSRKHRPGRFVLDFTLMLPNHLPYFIDIQVAWARVLIHEVIKCRPMRPLIQPPQSKFLQPYLQRSSCSSDHTAVTRNLLPARVAHCALPI